MSLKVYIQVYSLEIRKILSYRADFWITVVGAVLITLAIAYFLWTSIFEFTGKEMIGGLNEKTMIFYFLLAPLFMRMANGGEFGSISRDIYYGELNKYLIYPVSYLGFKIVGHFAKFTVFFIQLILSVVLYHFVVGIPDTIQITWFNILLTIPYCFLGSLLYFYMGAILESVAFWADNVWSLSVALRFAFGILGGAMIPLTLYPLWAQDILFYMPFEKIIHAPLKIFIGQYNLDLYMTGLGLLVFWIIFFVLIFQLIWTRAQKVYTGVGI